MKYIGFLLVIMMICSLLVACGGTGAGPGQDPLAENDSGPAAAETEVEGSSGICAALPTSLLLLGAMVVAVNQSTKTNDDS